MGEIDSLAVFDETDGDVCCSIAHAKDYDVLVFELCKITHIL